MAARRPMSVRILGRIRTRFLLMAVLLILFAPAAKGQDLAETYRKRWFRETAERILNERGLWARPFPPAHLHSESDSIRWRHEWKDRLDRSHVRVPAVNVQTIRAVRRLERPVYSDWFVDVPRAFIGAGGQSAMDIERTRALRARLQHQFGSPTRTVVDLYDQDRRQFDEYIQFEYWMIVNDSIPLIVMDVDGPFDRGLVLATDARFRDLLPDLKTGFERSFMRREDYEAYADYYFNEVERAWYVAGFDGERFVLRRIRTPSMQHGRPGIGMLR